MIPRESVGRASKPALGPSGLPSSSSLRPLEMIDLSKTTRVAPKPSDANSMVDNSPMVRFYFWGKHFFIPRSLWPYV
jgi:hypothetical protein